MQLHQLLLELSVVLEYNFKNPDRAAVDGGYFFVQKQSRSEHPRFNNVDCTIFEHAYINYIHEIYTELSFIQDQFLQRIRKSLCENEWSVRKLTLLQQVRKLTVSLN